MKHYFVAATRLKNQDGSLLLDGEGAFYYGPHPHEVFKNKDGSPKEFTGPGELMATIIDFNVVNDKAVQPKAGVGEVIVQEIYQF